MVRAGGEDHLLGAPGVVSSSGLQQMMAIKTLLEEYEIADHVSIICFDTTASNTGAYAGAIYR